MISYRYPDNPVEVGIQEIYRIERDYPGQYIGQFKWDGWRRPLYFDEGTWTQYSKHDAHAKEFPPESLVKELYSLPVPSGTAFDSEWMGRRCTALLRGRHYFVLFDLLYLNGEWLGDLPYRQRYIQLASLFQTFKVQNIELAKSYELGLVKLFEESKKNPLTEGIVAKKLDSKYKGGRGKSLENGNWFKVKWRA